MGRESERIAQFLPSIPSPRKHYYERQRLDEPSRRQRALMSPPYVVLYLEHPGALGNQLTQGQQGPQLLAKAPRVVAFRGAQLCWT